MAEFTVIQTVGTEEQESWERKLIIKKFIWYWRSCISTSKSLAEISNCTKTTYSVPTSSANEGMNPNLPSTNHPTNRSIQLMQMYFCVFIHKKIFYIIMEKNGGNFFMNKGCKISRRKFAALTVNLTRYALNLQYKYVAAMKCMPGQCLHASCKYGNVCKGMFYIIYGNNKNSNDEFYCFSFCAAIILFKKNFWEKWKEF